MNIRFRPIKKRLLITGASGLIGRLCFNYLSKFPSYEVYGIDKQLANSERYTLDHKESAELPKFPKEKFFIVDITQPEQITNILKKNKIDIVIHLAAVLENQPVSMIEKVNKEGTFNVYQACLEAKVKRVIYASSIMLVWDYFSKEPYSSIRKNQFEGDTDKIPMITTKSELLIATDNPSYEAYCKSKIFGEQIAEEFASKNQLSSICARFGWVNVDNQPTLELSSIWCSHLDVCVFIQKAIEADIVFGKYFVCSDNKYRWVDISNAKSELGFIPHDKAENYSSNLTPRSFKI